MTNTLSYLSFVINPSSDFYQCQVDWEKFTDDVDSINPCVIVIMTI